MMPPQHRLAAIIVIWVIVAILLLTMLGTSYLAEGGLFAWILAISVAGIAGGVTSSLAETPKPENKPWIDVKVNTDKSKAKRGDNLAEMMALLDEDDIYDLRQRIKERLMDQIDSGSLEDVESFEHLLSSRERQKRK